MRCCTSYAFRWLRGANSRVSPNIFTKDFTLPTKVDVSGTFTEAIKVLKECWKTVWERDKLSIDAILADTLPCLGHKREPRVWERLRLDAYYWEAKRQKRLIWKH